jgi:hypothetical protein
VKPFQGMGVRAFVLATQGARRTATLGFVVLPRWGTGRDGATNASELCDVWDGNREAVGEVDELLPVAFVEGDAF